MTERLNIAMLSVHSCPVGKLGTKDTGGISVYIREVAQELANRGHTVDIYTRTHDPMDNQIVKLCDNARVIHLQAGEADYTHKLVVYSHLADFACSLENFRKREGLQYDLIHSHYWLSGWVGRQLRDWWAVPHVTMFHTLGLVKNAVGVGEDEPELRIVTEKELANNCQGIIVATDTEKIQLINYYNASPETISVIPCGVNLGTFQPLDKEISRQRLGLNGGNIVLFVGRIEPLKGIDRLLTAVSSLNNRKDLTLVIVGGDDASNTELEKLHRLSHSLHIGDSVVFAGTIRHEELPFYYSAADVCVIPSFYESFGLVALESLSCGTPIVATKVGGIERIIQQGQNGYAVQDNNPVNLADGIASLLIKVNAGAVSADSIRGSINGLCWVNIAEEIISEYLTVLGKEFTSEGITSQLT